MRLRPLAVAAPCSQATARGSDDAAVARGPPTGIRLQGQGRIAAILSKLH